MSDGAQAIGSAKHLPLIVWCADAKAGDPVLRALEQGFELKLQDALSDFDGEGTPGTDTDTDTDTLLLVLSPTEMLFRAMAGGVLPSAALVDWLEQVQAILRLNRRNRQRVHILEIAMACHHPKAFLKHFDLPEAANMIAALSAEDARNPSGPADEVLLLLAQQTLSGNMQARALLGELEAASLNFTDDRKNPGGAPDAAFLSYRDVLHASQQTKAAGQQVKELQAGLAKRDGQIEALESARDAAGQQVKVLQAGLAKRDGQIEALEGARDAAGQQVKDLQAGLAKRDGQIEALKGARDEDLLRSREQVELLQAQNSSIQTEMEKVYKQSLERAEQVKELAMARDGADQKIQALRADLAGLNQQRIEREQALEQTGEDLRLSRQEVEILLAQSRVMQGELETLTASQQQLEQRLGQLNHGMDSYQAQVKELQAEQSGLKIRVAEKNQSLEAAGMELLDLEARVAQLNTQLARTQTKQTDTLQLVNERQQQIEALESQLRQFLNSRSYRLTAPLRLMRKLMSGRKRA